MAAVASQQIAAGEVVELLRELIRNGCVNDGTPESGHEHRSVATLDAYLGRPGRAFEPAPGRQSAFYRVPGTDPGAPRLLLLAHTDVVPVTPDGWSRDPFGGDLVDGVVWGRGAVDMLNQTAAMAAVFRRYLDGDVPPLPGDLLFLAVADEENGGKLGAEWIVEHAWDEVACEYLLTEIAMPRFPSDAGPVLPVTVAEKGPHWRRIATSGIPGHASQPYARANALVPVVEAMARLAAAPAPVAITDEWRTFVAALRLPPEREAALLDVDRIDDAIDDLAVDDPGFARWVHACTHMTVAPTVIAAGTKANVIPDAGRAEVDVRILPGQETADVDDHFRKAIGPAIHDELDVEPVMDHLANGSAAAGPLWQAIGEAHDAVAGSALLAPTLIPVTTDARFFRSRGTIAYGVGLFDDETVFGDLLAMFHGNDERVSVESMRRTTALLERTVARFGELTRPG